MKSKLIAAGLAAALLAVSTSGVAHAQPDSDSASAAAPTPRGPVEVVVWNIRKGLGHIRVSICTRLNFASNKKTCPYHGDAPAHVGATTVVVPDVPAGTFAAEVYQDEQDLNTLKRGALGVPQEGVGFSNDASVLLTGPRFDDSSFDHDPATPLTVRIKLRYFPNL